MRIVRSAAVLAASLAVLTVSGCVILPPPLPSQMREPQQPRSQPSQPARPSGQPQTEVQPVLPGLPPTVEAIRRGRLLTVINYGDEAVDVEVQGLDAVDGQAVSKVSLQPFGYALVLTDA